MDGNQDTANHCTCGVCTSEKDTEVKRLAAALSLEDTVKALLILDEAVGNLVLMCHWLRGIFTWLHFTGAVKYSKQSEVDNYNRLNDLLASTEEIVWSIAPPRAMLPLLKEWRETGKLEEFCRVLTDNDSMGRYVGEDESVKALVNRLTNNT